MLQTRYNRTKKDYREPGGGENLVEVAGYVSAKDRIERLINAGKNLLNFRKENYDTFDENIDRVSIDPTRKALDFAEADDYLASAVFNINKAKEAFNVKKDSQNITADLNSGQNNNVSESNLEKVGDVDK